MPISHQHRMLFVHIPKTGGSSIERVLGVWGRDNRGGLEADLSILFGKHSGRHLQHLTFREIVERGHLQGDPASYLSFAIVRNPWDRLVSEFEYLSRRDDYADHGIDTFERFVDAFADGRFAGNAHFTPQVDFVHGPPGGEALQRIGRFERLGRDFKAICHSAGASVPPLPLTKRIERRHYSHYYDSRTMAVVRERYAQDITTFGYRFERFAPVARLRRPLLRAGNRLRSKP